MVSYFMRYRGWADDADEFNANCETIGAEILSAIPTIQSLLLHCPTPRMESFSINRGDCALLAQMVFRSAQDLEAALQPEARRRARDNIHRFPPFTGSVIHEAMAGCFSDRLQDSGDLVAKGVPNILAANR